MSATAKMTRQAWTCCVSDVRISQDEVASTSNATLAALTDRYRGRGFLRAAKEHEKDMDAMEEEARAQAPAHYRWDELCANGRGDCFRNANYLGRQVMGVDDFAAYFAECRESRRAACDESVAEQQRTEVIPARTREQSRMAHLMGTSLVSTRAAQPRENASDRLIAFAKDWLRPDDPSLRRNGVKRRVPVTVISALIVMAVSLMMIVSSSVMVANAKREVSKLDDEVAVLEKEAQLAEDKLESNIDYLAIYRTATEELGMIPATYVNSMYLDTTDGNSIEVVAAEEDEAPGLSTLLSAIGITIGEQ